MAAPDSVFQHPQFKAKMRIGATGHRFLAERERLETAVDQALGRFLEGVRPDEACTISALAEGADRLIAERALMRGVRLVAVLPLPREDYLRDFPTNGSKQEFEQLLAKAESIIELAGSGSRNAAYVAGGRFIVEHSDVVIALWDGAVEQGTGGTASVVGEARLRKMPIAWVHAGNRRPGTRKAISLGKAQGTLTFENLEAQENRP